MFEYLIVCDVNGQEERDVVGFEGLLEHIQKAMDDDAYTFWAYEIHRIAVDFSIPRRRG